MQDLVHKVRKGWDHGHYWLIYYVPISWKHRMFTEILRKYNPDMVDTFGSCPVSILKETSVHWLISLKLVWTLQSFGGNTEFYGKFHMWGEACLLKMYIDSTKQQVKKCPSDIFVLPRNIDSFLISSQFGTLFSSNLLSGHKKFSSFLSAFTQIIHKVCN